MSGPNALRITSLARTLRHPTVFLCEKSFANVWPLFASERSSPPMKPSPQRTMAVSTLLKGWGAFMRMSVIVSAICLCLVSVGQADSAKAAIRKFTDIPAEKLGPALQTLAKDYDFQVLYRTEIVNTLKTQGVSGSLTSDEALGKVLSGTGLTYKYLDDKTVTIVSGESPETADLPPSHQTPSDQPNEVSTAKDGRKYSSQDFRLAQASPGQAGGDTSVESDQATAKKNQSEVLQEVVVTGRYQFLSADTSGTTNLPLPIEQVPQSISLVSNDFIQAADLKTLGAIAEYTPGALNGGNSENTRTNISLRGFNTGLSIDGINILGYTFFEPDYAIYDRLEIVKGPSSVVYGVSSPGGVVNYVTKSATAQTRDYVYAQAGSWRSYRVEGQITGALDAEGHVRAIGIAVQDQGDSFIDQIYHKNTIVYGGLNVDLGNSVTAYLHGGYERQEQPSFDGVPTELDGTAAPLNRSFFIGSKDIGTTATVYHAEGDVTWHATDMLDLSIKGNYQTVGINGKQDYSFGLRPSGGLGIEVTALDARATNYGIGASSIFKFDDLGLKNSFVSLGALYQHNNYRADYLYPPGFGIGRVNVFDGQAAVSQAFDSLAAGPFPAAYDSLTQADTLTFSGQSILQVMDPLKILLGVSYSKPKESVDSNDFKFSGQTSYRAGVTYEFLPRTYAYVSYSQSFNPQTQIGVGGVALPPITGDQYELGVKYRDADGRLLLTAAAFQIKERNVAQFLAGSINFFYPIGELTHRGLELQGLGQITRQWQINAGYAYLDPKITNDSDPSNIGQTEQFLSKQTFSVFTTYTLYDGLVHGLTFGGGARYVSSQRTSFDGSTRDLPGYSLIDATVSYAVNKWHVQLNARNVLDRHYFINNYQTLFYGNMIGDPANVALSVRRQF